ncbi:MAG: hypothetical protein KKC26_06740, partial [Nanoarchaeota archaeon]|nr:hypothetical protein [Nanoarchaeota archaeon]
SVENNEENIFEYNFLGNGNHSWYVFCYDTSGNYINITPNNFTVQETTDLYVNVSTDSIAYSKGEIVTVTTDVDDEFGNPVSSATIKTDIILGNTTYPWWNTDWKLRKPLLLTETMGDNRTEVNVRINITGLLGNITDCTNELRIVSRDLKVIPFNVLGGDDTSYCDVIFQANVSANANDEDLYFAYFNNSNAPNTNYNTISGKNHPLFFDDFNTGTEPTANLWTESGGLWNIEGQKAHADTCASPGDYVISITNTTASYEYLNVTFSWEVSSGTLEAADCLSFDTYNGTAWNTQFEKCDDQGSTSGLKNIYLGSEYLIDLFQIRFFCINGVSDEQVWIDNVNVTGYTQLDLNLSATVGSTQEWISRNQTTTGATGIIEFSWNTADWILGYYSATSLAQHADFKDGSSYDLFEIIPDATPPKIELLKPENNNKTNNPNIVFSYTPNDFNVISGCSLYLDSEFNQTNNTITKSEQNNFSVSNLSEGHHSWFVNCTDQYSNSNISKTFNFTVDLSEPNTTFSSPENNSYTSDTTPEINFTITDDFSDNLTYKIFVDGLLNGQSGDANNNTPILLNLSFLSEGSRQIIIEAEDEAGNKKNSTTLIINVDLTEPKIILYNPLSEDIFNSENVLFNFTFADSVSPNATCNLTVNGILRETVFVEESIAYNMTISGFETGTYYWNVTCKDYAGYKNTSLTKNFSVDILPPQITLGTPENNSYFSNEEIIFLFYLADTGISIANCSLILNDGKYYVKNDSLQINSYNNITTIIATGDYEWSINCTDSSGNEGASPTTKTIIVDTEAPTIFSLISPSDGTISDDLSPTFIWQTTTDNNFDNYTIQIDNSATFESINYQDSTHEVDNLSITMNIATDTTWYWKVLAFDKAGNNRTSTQTFTYTTDTSAPTVILRSPANNDQDPDGNITFFYTVSDVNISHCALYINLSGIFEENKTDTVSNGLNSFTLNNLPANTTFIWNVLCTDGLGYNSFYSENWTVFIKGVETFYQNLTIKSNLSLYNTLPRIKNMQLESPINLVAGINKSVNCTFEVEDDNGVADIQSVVATFYHSTSSSGAADDYNSHYSKTCSCTNIDTITNNCTCEVDIRYYALNGTWTCNATATDEVGSKSDTKTTTINELRALYVTPFQIDYGNLESEQTSPSDVSVTIKNIGNSDIDISLFGYGDSTNDNLSMTCEHGEIIAGYQKLSLNLGMSYSLMTVLSALSTSPNMVDANITKQTIEGSDSTLDMYWKIQIPVTAQGVCAGSIVFSAEADT